MKTKLCKKCNTEKSVEDFFRDNDKSDGRQTQCKSCKKKYRKANPRWKSGNDPYFSVYYLPAHRYVGMTANVKMRMHDHKKRGKDVEGMQIIGTFDTAIEAHTLETLMHLSGFEGFHYWNKK